MSECQKDCAGMVSQLFGLLHRLPAMSQYVQIDTSDLSFHNQLQECSANIDVEKVDLEAKNVLPRTYQGRFFYDRNPEEATRDINSNGKKTDAEDELPDQEIEDIRGAQFDDWVQEDSLYMDVVENCSQRYTSR